MLDMQEEILRMGFDKMPSELLGLYTIEFSYQKSRQSCRNLMTEFIHDKPNLINLYSYRVQWTNDKSLSDKRPKCSLARLSVSRGDGRSSARRVSKLLARSKGWEPRIYGRVAGTYGYVYTFYVSMYTSGLCLLPVCLYFWCVSTSGVFLLPVDLYLRSVSTSGLTLLQVCLYFRSACVTDFYFAGK